MSNRITVAERIDNLIDEVGTLRGVARKIGVDVGYLSRLHKGEKNAPSVDVLKKLGLQPFLYYELIKEEAQS